MTEYWIKREKEAEAWNRHPWNQKAKELLTQLENEDEIVGLNPEAPYVLQLAEWGINSLPEYQRKTQIPSLPHQPRNTLQNDLIDLIEGLLTNRTPKEAMEFLLETPWDASDAARPYGGGLPETDRAGRGSSRDTGESDGTDAVVVERARLEAAVSTYTPIREQHVDTPRHVIGIDPEDRQYRLYAFTKRLSSRYRLLHSGVIRTAPYRHLANALIRTTKSLRLDKILTTLLFGEPVVL